MVHNIIIYDTEKYYSQKLAGYMNTQKAFPFEARFFDSRSELEIFVLKNDIDIMLIADNLLAEVEDISVKLRLRLTDDSVGNIHNSEAIYKYQSCETIIRQILSQVADNTQIGRLAIRSSFRKIIGFYSPVKRTGQTTLALAMGQLIAEEYKTLFVSLEGNSGLCELLGLNFSMDMSDMLYDLRNGSRDVAASIGGNVQKLGKMDIFPIMADIKDLASVNYREWVEFIKKLESDTDYEFVILDISDSVRELSEVLCLCEKVFMTLASDKMAYAKKNQYYGNLGVEYSDRLKELFIECELPLLGDDGKSIGDMEVRDYAKSVWNMAGII